MIYRDYVKLTWSTSGREGFCVPHYIRRRGYIRIMGVDLYDEARNFCGYWSARQMAKPLLKRLTETIRWGIPE